MRRVLFILAALLISLSVTTGTVAHAMEPVACLDAGTASSLGHSAGDGDQAPADAEKDYVHHHGGCHGHQVGDSIEAPRVEPLFREAALVPSDAGHFVATAPADPALRPPIA